MVSPVVDMSRGANKHSGLSGIATQLLVLHSAESPLAAGYARSLTEWSRDSAVQASWQRFVDPGARVRYVPDDLAAWHAGYANPMSIGWEQAGYARFSRAEWTTPAGMQQLDNLAFDMAGEAKRNGIPLVWLTTDQVRNIVFNGDRKTRGFCIHAQIEPANRTDPGAGYPYDLLTSKIAHYLGAPLPAPVVKPKPNPAPPKTVWVRDPHWLVEKGESMSQIAVHYKTTVSKLASYNGIKDPNKITVGDVIWPPTGMGTWTIEKGDTLGKVVAWVQKNWLSTYTLERLQNTNGINDPNVVSVGTRLNLK